MPQAAVKTPALPYDRRLSDDARRKLEMDFEKEGESLNVGAKNLGRVIATHEMDRSR